MMDQRDQDLSLLRRLVGELKKHEDKEEQDFFATLATGHLHNFVDMLDRIEKWRIRMLTDKQRSYARSITEKLFDEPQYENLWSSGKGRGDYGKTEVPAVLRAPLPLKPPGRA